MRRRYTAFIDLGLQHEKPRRLGWVSNLQGSLHQREPLSLAAWSSAVQIEAVVLHGLDPSLDEAVDHLLLATLESWIDTQR